MALFSSGGYAHVGDKDNENLALGLQVQLLQQAHAISQRLISSSPTDNKESTARPSMIEAFMTSPKLPASEKTPKRIKGESLTAIGAGTLTTAHVLKAATYHILANAPILENLLNELSSHFPNRTNAPPPTLPQLEKCTYFVAIMHESLRIAYGVTHRLQRIFPDRSLQYGQYSIPPGIPISMTTLHIHDNQVIFPDSYRFDPERWTIKNPPLRYLTSFGKGVRSCVGMELAKAEILTTMAAVFGRL